MADMSDLDGGAAGATASGVATSDRTPAPTTRSSARESAAALIQSAWRGAQFRGLHLPRLRRQQVRLYPATVLKRLKRLRAQNEGFKQLLSFVVFMGVYIAAVTLRRDVAAEHTIMGPMLRHVHDIEFGTYGSTAHDVYSVEDTWEWLHAALRDLYNPGAADPMFGDPAVRAAVVRSKYGAGEDGQWSAGGGPSPHVLGYVSFIAPELVRNLTMEYLADVSHSGMATDAELAALSERVLNETVQTQAVEAAIELWVATRSGSIVDQASRRGTSATGMIDACFAGMPTPADVPRTLYMLPAMMFHNMERTIITGESKPSSKDAGYLHRGNRFLDVFLLSSDRYPAGTCASRFEISDAEEVGNDGGSSADVDTAFFPRCVDEAADPDESEHFAGFIGHLSQAPILSAFKREALAADISRSGPGPGPGPPSSLGGGDNEDGGVSTETIVAPFLYLLDSGSFGLGMPSFECQLAHLHEERLFDYNVRNVKFGFIAYNGAMDQVAFVEQVFHFSAGGEVEPELLGVAVAALVPHWIEAVFALLLVAQTVGECREVCQVSCWSYLGSLWNAVDIVALCALWASTLTWWVTWVIMLEWEPKVIDLQSPTAVNEVIAGQLELVELATTFDAYVSMTAFSLFLAAVRLFKHLRFHERVSVVTRTLESAAEELLHFFLLASLVLFLFAHWGTQLLGSHLGAFSSTSATSSTLMRWLIGDFDPTLDDISVVAPVGGPMFFWSFVTVWVFALLNVLLAVFLDAFVEVQANSRDTETVFESMYMFVVPLCIGPFQKCLARFPCACCGAMGGARKNYVAPDSVQRRVATAAAAVSSRTMDFHATAKAAMASAKVSSTKLSLRLDELEAADHMDDPVPEKRARVFFYTDGIGKALRLWALRARAEERRSGRTGDTMHILDLQTILANVTSRANIRAIMSYFGELPADDDDDESHTLTAQLSQIRAQLRFVKQRVKHLPARGSREALDGATMGGRGLGAAVGTSFGSRYDVLPGISGGGGGGGADGNGSRRAPP